MWNFLLLADVVPGLPSISEGVTISLTLFLWVIGFLGTVIGALFGLLMKEKNDRVTAEKAHSDELKAQQEAFNKRTDELREEFRTEYNDVVSKYMLLGDKTANEIQASTNARGSNEKALTDLFAMLRVMQSDITFLKFDKKNADGG